MSDALLRVGKVTYLIAHNAVDELVDELNSRGIRTSVEELEAGLSPRGIRQEHLDSILKACDLQCKYHPKAEIGMIYPVETPEQPKVLTQEECESFGIREVTPDELIEAERRDLY
jgi:hypothetical protein